MRVTSFRANQTYLTSDLYFFSNADIYGSTALATSNLPCTAEPDNTYGYSVNESHGQQYHAAGASNTNLFRGH